MPDPQAWRRHLKEAFRSPQELGAFLGAEVPPAPFPLLIPRRLAERIRAAGPDSPLYRQFVPAPEESLPGPGLTDPIGDQIHAVPGQLIHRYPNRALFLPTSVCPVHCRYCFRQNQLAEPADLFAKNMPATLAYLRSHPQIEEIIYSGGDPLILSTDKLRASLAAFAELPSVRYIRFHTRTPVALPERFDDPALKELFAWAADRFSLLSLTAHLNHPRELDAPAEKLFRRLKRWPLRLLTQSVLLKGVNDNLPALKELFLRIASLAATPYYLHHPDAVRGGERFILSRREGADLYRRLRRELPAQALPHYVVELPRGAGKELALAGEFH